MNIFKNLKIKKWVLVFLITAALTFVFFLNYEKVFTHTATLNGKELWNYNYGEKLWNRLSQGDVSSVSCQKAIAKYSQENPLNRSNSFESFYSYSKKRCLGLDSQNFLGLDSEYAGHTDKIFDLITGDTLVSCTLDLEKKVYPHVISCNDSQNVWTHDIDSEPMPPPYPIYSNTWAALNTMGRE